MQSQLDGLSSKVDVLTERMDSLIGTLRWVAGAGLASAVAFLSFALMHWG